MKASFTFGLLLLAPLLLAQSPSAAPRPKLQFINGSTQAMDIFWLKSPTERVPNGSVAPGDNTIITTTLGHRFAVVGRDGKGERIITSEVPVQAMRFDPPDPDGIPAFYTQRQRAGGFPIVASAKVNPYALKEATYLLDLILAKRPDVRAAMVKSGARLCIIGWNEFTTDQPEFARLGKDRMKDFPRLSGKDYWDTRARGLGGSATDPFCSCAEENLLCYTGDPYSAENILIHEFAHNIHLRGMANVDPGFDRRVKAAYDAAMKAGLWKGKYAAVNHHEYFAEGVQSWFDNNRFNDHDHNHVHLRSQLIEYDPGLAAVCREVFGDTELKYTKPQTRLTGHLAGYDPEKAPEFVWPERLQEARKQIRAAAQSRDRAANDPNGRDTRDLVGWQVHISRKLLTDTEKKTTERALELMQAQLERITRIVPAKAVAELKKVPLYVSPPYEGVRPRAEYHPDKGWLAANQRDPVMAKAVEFTDTRDFEAESRRMPVFVLHELAHAYHDRVLPGGHDHAEIKAAYQKAKASGKYDRVERQDSEGRKRMDRAYALTNPAEYFAETTEAFFAENDFFPFNREQLRAHDPEMFALLGKLWGTEAAAAPGASAPRAASTAAASATPPTGWRHTGQLVLLTTPDGAALPAGAMVEEFPVLVRLHRDWFDFTQARPDGADVQFTSESGAVLAHEVDAWDAAGGTASVWVRVPRITGNARQTLHLHWGQAGAVNASSGKAVFNESNGYLSVWHLGDTVRDEVGTLESKDTGTSLTNGIIGQARHFPGKAGIFGGDKIPNYPTGADAHSSEVWFRTRSANSTLVAWGNEQGQGKVVMQLRSPPHINMDCYFSGGNVSGNRLPLGDWMHVVHTYRQGESIIYVNGQAQGTNASKGSPLNIRTPARLWLGGWYNNYNFVGDLDEVRVSKVTRSAEWVRLQYENQKPQQTLVGPLVPAGNAFAVSPEKSVVEEGKSVTFTAQAGGAQKVYWILKRDGREEVVATDRFKFTFAAGRVTGDATATLQLKAVFADGVKTKDISITVKEAIPEPVFTLKAPAAWDGRAAIEVVSQVANLAAMQAKGAGELKFEWSAGPLAVIKEVAPGKLRLLRAQNSGPLTVTATVSNGGKPTSQSVTIAVTEPKRDAWVARVPAKDEQPEDGQFYARDDKNEGTLYYNGTLAEAADAVFLKLFAEDKLVKTEAAKPGADKSFALAVKLKPGLVKYRVEFGTRAGGKETVLRRVGDLVCGDVFLIDGQSNALATDTGEKSPPETSEWIRSYGGPTGRADGVAWVRERQTAAERAGLARPNLWCRPVWKRSTPEQQAELGWWGMELAKRLVASNQMPVCIIQAAIGGSRIDEHQASPADHGDLNTMYGRMLWRVRQAGLTHGIRGILWHQGENDQGADGPTGGFGWESYQRLFIEMAGAWKQDFPNVQHYYVFQIWPNSCAMGGRDGAGDRLREQQRTLPQLFSNLSILSTLGVRPPGGCHFPLAGWGEFARMAQPLIERDVYGKPATTPLTAPNLRRVAYAGGAQDALRLEFDQPVVWTDALAGQFYLDGEKDKVASGSVAGNVLTLKLKEPLAAKQITYLKEVAWNQDTLLLGANGLAALTFCEVPIAGTVAKADKLRADK